MTGQHLADREAASTAILEAKQHAGQIFGRDVNLGALGVARAGERLSEAPAEYRTGITVIRSASTDSICRPETCSAISHQCDPMSPSAELLPPFAGSERQE